MALPTTPRRESSIHNLEKFRKRLRKINWHEQNSRLLDWVRRAVFRCRCVISWRSTQSFFLGTTGGIVIILMALGIVLVLIIMAFCWMATHVAYDEDWPTAEGPGTLWHEMWNAFGYLLDPGKMAELSARSHPTQLIIACASASVGLVWTGALLGLIIDQVSVSMQSVRRRNAKVAERGHILVLGWTEKTLHLLGELAQMLTDGKERGGTIVVLGQEDPFEMREEVNVTHSTSQWPDVHFIFWQGQSHEVDDMNRVAVAEARLVIVLGSSSRNPHISDSLVLTTLCALQCLPRESLAVREQAAEQGLIAEISLPQNVKIAQQLGGSTTRAITATMTVDKLIATAALSATEARAFVELMSFEGSQIEFVSAADLVSAATAAGVHALTFGIARQCFPLGIVLGVRHGNVEQASAQPRRISMMQPFESFVDKRLSRMNPSPLTSPNSEVGSTMWGARDKWAKRSLPPKDLDSMRLELAPSDDSLIESTDSLLVIADSFATANTIVLRKKAVEHLAEASERSVAARSGDLVRIEIGTASRSQYPSCQRGGGVESGASALSAPQSSCESISSDAAPTLAPVSAAITDDGMTVLMLGWSPGMVHLLHAFDKRLPPGSTIHILSQKPLHKRQAVLATEGLSLHGGPYTESTPEMMGDEPDPSVSHQAGRESGRYGAADSLRDSTRESTRCSSANPPRGAPALSHRDSAQTMGLENVRLEHLVGYSTDETSIRRLPLQDAAAAIVCADGGQLNKADTQIDDADVMSTTLILRRVYESRMRRLRRMKRDRATVGEGASAARNLPLTLVIEFNDSLTRRLLRRRPDLLNPNHGDPSNESTNIGLSADSFTPIIDEVYLHRGYLETTALSISAHSHVDWSIMQLLLTHGSGASVRALSVADVLDPHELSPHPGTATRTVMPPPRLTPRQRHEESPANARARRSVLATLGISVGRLMGARARAASPHCRGTHETVGPVEQSATQLWSFYELASRVSAVGEGVLIGWRRTDEWVAQDEQRAAAGSNAPSDSSAPGKTTRNRLINPKDKELELPWCAQDSLLVVQLDGDVSNDLRDGNLDEVLRRCEAGTPTRAQQTCAGAMMAKRAAARFKASVSPEASLA